MSVYMRMWIAVWGTEEAFCLKTLSTAVYTVYAYNVRGRGMMCGYGALVEWYWEGITEVPGVNILQMQLLSPPISRELRYPKKATELTAEPLPVHNKSNITMKYQDFIICYARYM
jgi:hypothetical protein